MSKTEKDKVKKLFYSNKNFDILKNIIGEFIKKNFEVEITSKYDKYIIDTMKSIYKNKPVNTENLSNKAYNQLLNKATLDETLIYISKEISSKISGQYKIDERPASSNMNKEDTSKSFEEIISNRRQSLNNIPKPIDFSDPVDKKENAEELFLKEQKKRENEAQLVNNQTQEKEEKKTSGPQKPVQDYKFQNQILSSIQEEQPNIVTPLEPVSNVKENVNNSLDDFIDNESTDGETDNLEPSSNSVGMYADFNNEQEEDINEFMMSQDNSPIDNVQTNVQTNIQPNVQPNVQSNVQPNFQDTYQNEIEKLRQQFFSVEKEIVSNRFDSSVFEQLVSINTNNLNTNKKMSNLNEVTNNNIDSMKDNINKILNILVETESKINTRNESSLSFISNMLDKAIDKLVLKLNPQKDMKTTNLVLSSRDREIEKYNQINDFVLKLNKSYSVNGFKINRIFIPENNLIHQTPINFIHINEFNWKDSLVFVRNANSFDEYTVNSNEVLFDESILINNLSIKFQDMFGNLLNFNNNLHKSNSYKTEKDIVHIGYESAKIQKNDYIRLFNFKFNNDTVTETIINRNEGYQIMELTENMVTIRSSVNKNPNFIGSFINVKEQIYISIDLII